MYYYRDKDGKEIDLLFVQDRAIHPMEIRKSANPRREWAQQFAVLDRRKPSWAKGGFVCLCRERLPLKEKVTAKPVGLLQSAVCDRSLGRRIARRVPFAGRCSGGRRAIRT